MCGSKYDWGHFNEDTGEWEFPRYLVNGEPADADKNERHVFRWLGDRLFVLMRSARSWARSMRVRQSLPDLHRAFVGGFMAECSQTEDVALSVDENPLETRIVTKRAAGSHSAVTRAKHGNAGH